MKKAFVMGRLTRDPEIMHSRDERNIKIARYTLAVDCSGNQRAEGKTADYFNCIAFDKRAEFAEKHFSKGLRVLISGQMNTGSYINKEGVKIPTFEIIVDSQEFADAPRNNANGEFMNCEIPEDPSLPFN